MITFTDRYGGRAPAWIRGCHGDCEAMGFYPTQEWSIEDERERGVRPRGTPEADGTPDDGWRFVKCPECRGTGRVPWWVSLSRIPAWIIKGLRFIASHYSYPARSPQETPWQRFRTLVWCAFGSDLVAIWRRY